MTKKDIVLVIDDDYETLRLLKLALERAGLSVLTAASWQEVSNRVQNTYKENTPIDIIVLDLMMPERSGFDIYRSLQIELVTMPPVIMLTAVTGMQQRVDARDLGVTKYLTKPTTPSKLIETIQEVLKETQKANPQSNPIDRFPPKRFSG